MRNPFVPREFVTEPLGRADAAAIAALHEEEFARPWSEDEFDALLAQPAVFGFAAREIGHPGAPMAGFVLARQAADEGEILTLAVARAERGQGLGRDLVEAVMRALYAERATAVFLEVDAGNAPALSLYLRLGFHQVGVRPTYYRDGEGPPSDALVMRRDLR